MDIKKPHIAYAAVQYKNVVKHPDGTCLVDISNKDVLTADKEFSFVYGKVATAHKASYEMQEITL